MYGILGAITGLSITSAIYSFRCGDTDYGVKFVMNSVLSVLALVLLFIKEG